MQIMKTADPRAWFPGRDFSRSVLFRFGFAAGLLALLLFACGGELTTEVYCNCGANYAIRPCCWAEGGMSSSGSYGAPTQTMSVWCSG